MLDRLQKIIAHAGVASRRHAEQLILSGQVRVNGQIVTELGTKADPSRDKIEAAGRLIGAEEDHVYLLLHKPPEVVSTLADPEGRRTLRNFLRGFPKRVYPVGSLDYADSGLVFLTNDGDLTSAVLKSWSQLPQVYHIKIKGRLTLEELDGLGKETGTRLRTVRQPDSTRGRAANFWYEVHTTGARLEILRRALFKDLHPVEKVKRISLGHLSIGGVPQGRYLLLQKPQADSLRHPALSSRLQRPLPRSTRPHRHPTRPPKPKSPR